MSEILIFGKNGQLSQHLSMLLPRATNVGIDEVDLAYPDRVYKYLQTIRPRIVINAAAYTNVDLAEVERDLAFNVNTNSVAAMADCCASTGAKLIHISTDYVFDGSGDKPWTEQSPANPLSVYGQSKLGADRYLQQKHGLMALILRVSWVYSEYGANFLLRTLQWLSEKNSVSIVDDQIGSPTSANDLARAIVFALDHWPDPIPVGRTLNFCSGLPVTRWQLTTEIQEIALELGLLTKTIPIHKSKTTDFKTPAERPLNSRLSLDLWQKTFPGFPIPQRRDSLTKCLERIKAGLRHGG